MKTYIEIPFGEKEKARFLGARWDDNKKSWYCPDGVDLMKFTKWLPKSLQKWANPPRRRKLKFSRRRL